MKKEDIIKILDRIFKEYEIETSIQINLKIYNREEYLDLFDNEQRLEAAYFVDDGYVDNIVRKTVFVLMYSDYPDYGIINEYDSEASIKYIIVSWLKEVGLIIV